LCLGTQLITHFIFVIHNGIVFFQLQRLCGRRAKRQQQDMQLIEVSGDAIMPDPSEWLTKQMTQEQDTKTHSHRKKDGPTTQQSRKHQITYLAFQVWIKTGSISSSLVKDNLESCFYLFVASLTILSVAKIV
jgi:hypothetical protein